MSLPHSLTTGATRQLTGSVQPVSGLSGEQRHAMYRLLTRYFVNVTTAQFERDLAEKEAVILLHDCSGEIRGFSTLMRMHALVAGQAIVAFFSGDTIIERDFWGGAALPRLWALHVFGAAAASAAPVYWFLISSGYKTYRFLPTFFREFYPTYDRPTPAPFAQLMDTLAVQKFANAYDAATGIVRLPQAAALRADIAEITEQRMRDRHVAFFLAANPGHERGDELVCLTRIDQANLTAAGRRMLAD